MASPLYSYANGYGTQGAGRLGKYYVRLAVGPYVRPNPFAEAVMVPEKYVYLPLPMEMRDDTYASYSNSSELGLIGSMMNNGVLDSSNYVAELLRQSGSLVTGFGKMLGAGAKAVSNLGGPAVALGVQTITNGLENAFSAEQVTSAISQYLGASANPNPSVTFQGPRLRDMNFTWMLMPTSETDSANIRKVVNYLKRAALPQNTVKDSAAILEYPYMVRVNFYPWDQGGAGKYEWSPNSIMRMKHCFMSSVNVNYTAGNIPAFYEGTNEPVMIALSMNLIEAEYFLANDYDASLNGTGQSTFDWMFNKASGIAGEFLGNSDDDVGTAVYDAIGSFSPLSSTLRDAVE